MIPLSELRAKHKGEDVYVLGSGPSLSYISPKFLEDKIVICVNFTIDFVQKARSLYVVAKEGAQRMQRQARRKGALIVMCRHRFGAEKSRLNKILFPNRTVIYKPVRRSIVDTEQTECLEKSASTIHTAMHLAAFMGCKAIMLVGHDCGTIDNAVHAKGYDKRTAVTPGRRYGRWMKKNCVEYTTMKLKRILKESYDIEVYSLNPFINPNLEGHEYQSFS